MGMSPSQITRLRALAGQSLGIKATQFCTTTAIALELGEMNDPGVRVRTDLVLSWIATYASSCHRQRIDRCWMKLLPRLANKTRWCRAFGPIAAVQCTLRDIGWNPIAAGRWIDPRGDAWVVSDAASTKGIKWFLQRDCGLAHWARAAHYVDGGGLELGADLTVPLRPR
eukprot:15093690-Alexandrium_andersonii.AAC.1